LLDGGLGDREEAVFGGFRNELWICLSVKLSPEVKQVRFNRTRAKSEVPRDELCPAPKLELDKHSELLPGNCYAGFFP
jgi:hypothetical protein